MNGIPATRIRPAREAPVRHQGRLVLYWMSAARRSRYNFALQRAAERCRELRRPLVVLESVECGPRWASARHHRFAAQGMADNARAFRDTGVLYYPVVESRPDQTARLLEALCAQACVLVTDDFPCSYLPGLLAQVSSAVTVPVEAVDSNGLLPLRVADRVFPTAHSFRRFLQKSLAPHLLELPRANPLAGPPLPPAPRLPAEITRRWPPLALDESAEPELPAGLPINQSVQPAALRGGSRAAEKLLKQLLDDRLPRYDRDRNNPQSEAASGLSPYLHFGHVSAHEIFSRIAKREGWSPECLAEKASGSREGWWGMSPPAEAFLDQLITWRELGYNMTWRRDDYDRYDSLPEWARKTLAEHARDKRPQVYELEDFEAARTHDPLWNAAQRQLVREGRMHNYLRMLWGKKILHWSATPQDALETMIELNNRYALDGCNPNSYSGIFWVLGRYDRAWGPERPVFGKVRYMSSRNTARKIPVRGYLERYAE